MTLIKMIRLLIIMFIFPAICSADYLVLKLGTRGLHRTESEMRKDWVDGQIVEILPDTDPISDYMKTHFQIVKVAKKYTQEEKNEVLRSSYTETIDKNGIVTQGALITRRRYYVPITDITGMADSKTLATVYAKETVKPIADLTAFKETDIIKDSFKIQITTNSFDKGGSISVGTTSIGTGQDYATISAFEAGLAATLTGSVTGYINANYNDTTAVNFAGTTCAPDKQIYLTANDSFWANGKFDGTKASMTVSGTAVIAIGEGFVNISRIQISSANFTYGFRFTCDSSTITLKNCIVQGRNATDANSVVFVSGNWNIINIINVIGFNFYTNGTTGNLDIWDNGYRNKTRLYNCTLYGGYRQFYGNFGDYNCYNCVANFGTAGFNGVQLATSCVSSNGTDTTNNNKVGNVLFTNATNGDLSLVSTDTTAINTGMIITSNESPYTNPYAFGIEGNARTVWDIGAFEYVSAAPPAPVTYKQNKINYKFNAGMNYGLDN